MCRRRCREEEALLGTSRPHQPCAPVCRRSTRCDCHQGTQPSSRKTLPNILQQLRPRYIGSALPNELSFLFIIALRHYRSGSGSAQAFLPGAFASKFEKNGSRPPRYGDMIPCQSSIRASLPRSALQPRRPLSFKEG